MQKTNNLQEIFLTQVRREHRSVTMFLMNGFQMRGYVTGFDAFTVILTTDGKQQVVYTKTYYPLDYTSVFFFYGTLIRFDKIPYYQILFLFSFYLKYNFF